MEKGVLIHFGGIGSKSIFELDEKRQKDSFNKLMQMGMCNTFPSIYSSSIGKSSYVCVFFSPSISIPHQYISMNKNCYFICFDDFF